jgi:molybdopterin molybdotransferase
VSAGHLDLDAALSLLRERVVPLGAETVRIDEAAGRVLAEDVKSPIDVPPFARAAVDGYACRAADTFGAGPFEPVELPVAFEVLPGKPPSRALGTREVARIMTGAPVPEGADTVVMLEHAEASERSIRLVAALPPGKNVAPRGEDVTKGQVVAARGRRLRAEDVGVLASIRATTVRVHERPRVLAFSSGNELVDPLSDEPQREGTIFDSNGFVLEALARGEGALVERAGIVRDEREAIRAVLSTARSHVTVSSGGVSVGQEDFVPLLVRELGELWVHGVAIRPAHPIGFGRIQGRLHFALPGNPVAAWIGFRFFVRPALRLLSGMAEKDAFAADRTARAVLVKKVASVIGRTDFVRVRFTAPGQVEPVRPGGASALTSLTRADGIVTVPRELEGLEEGSEVEVELL